MKTVLCLLAAGAAALSGGDAPLPVDLSVAGDSSSFVGAQWTDIDWFCGCADLIVLGDLAIDLSHWDDRWAGPVDTKTPLSTPEPPGDAALGGLVLAYGAATSRRKRW